MFRMACPWSAYGDRLLSLPFKRFTDIFLGNKCGVERSMAACLQTQQHSGFWKQPELEAPRSLSSLTWDTVVKIMFTLKPFDWTAQAGSAEAAILVGRCQAQFWKEPVWRPFHQRLVPKESSFRWENNFLWISPTSHLVGPRQLSWLADGVNRQNFKRSSSRDHFTKVLCQIMEKKIKTKRIFS